MTQLAATLATSELRVENERLTIRARGRALLPRNGGDFAPVSEMPVEIAEQVSAEAHGASVHA